MTVINQVKRLKAAFPQAKSGFFDLVMERAKERGFSNEQLIDAANNLIDNFKYPQPMVSDIISWDKRVRLYSYSEITKKVTERGDSFDNYSSIKRNKRTFWISNAECEQYGIDIEKLQT